MKINLLVIGKTNEAYLNEGIDIFEKRLQHYCKYNRFEIPDIKNAKNLSKDQVKSKEAELIMSKISAQDFVVLLDERGQEINSIEFSQWLNRWSLQSISQICFVVGGPYGFDQKVYERANAKLSLSKMTFSHQMIRLFFVEQLYRAFSILKKEPYHHE